MTVEQNKDEIILQLLLKRLDAVEKENAELRNELSKLSAKLNKDCIPRLDSLSHGMKGAIDAMSSVLGVSQAEYQVKEQISSQEISKSEETIERAVIAAFYRLTARQHAILQMIMRAASNQDIADRLGVSLFTVKNHLTAIFRKFGVHKRSQLSMMVRPVFDSMPEDEYQRMTGGLAKGWDKQWMAGENPTQGIPLEI